MVTEEPWVTETFPELESEKSNGGGVAAVLVRLKLAGVATPDTVAVTV